MYKSITQYEGKPRDFASQVCGTTVCDNRSVIFGGRIEKWIKSEDIIERQLLIR